MDPRVVPRSDHPISRRQIDPDALKVLYRLHRHGRLAYLVGGGVRDLLLDVPPKDFDVVTDAHPGEVKKLFRNSWIIGRRFKLVHVVFGKNVIEVATFRAKSPPLEDGAKPAEGAAGDPPDGPSRELLVTRENTFGTPEQDALRRDFTINGLFYDIGTYSIIDYPGGLSDLEDRVIRTIGDPDIRFQEDPVRMMRAVKFAARLDFRLDPDTRRAIEQHAEAITWCAPPRVLEEVYRLLGSAKAAASFTLLQETGLLEHLLPEVASHAGRSGATLWEALAALDSWIAAGDGARAVSRAMQMAVLLQPLVADHLWVRETSLDSPGERIEEIIRPVCQRLRATRADTARILQIYLAQRRFIRPKGRRFSVAAFVRRGYFPEAWRLFRLHVESTGDGAEALRSWDDRVRQVLGEEPVESASPPGRRRRRRRRRRSRSGGRQTEAS